LIITVCLWLAGIEPLGPALVCASGVIIGLMLLIWERINRKEYRRLGE
jgi:hypothetical protein